MQTSRRQRTTQQVLDDHLRLRREGDLEADLARNYSRDCVLLTGYGVFHGHDGVRESAKRLKVYAPEGHYTYQDVLTHGDMGFLEWSARSDEHAVKDGADSYLIRDGVIHVQTIHYRPVER